MQESERQKAPTGRYLTPKERAEEERRQRKKEVHTYFNYTRGPNAIRTTSLVPSMLRAPNGG